MIDDILRRSIVKVAVEPRTAGEWFRIKLRHNIVMTNHCYDEWGGKMP